jgi:MFS family permease
MPNPINKIIRTLITSDIVLSIGWGFIGPVFAIFIVQNIVFNDTAYAAEVAGFASLIYWVLKSFLQIPIGRYLDKNHGEQDDFWFMFIGTFLSSFAPLIFMISSEPLHIYIAQCVQAVAMAMVIPSWSAIFTRHIDKGEEAYEWGMRSTGLGFGSGIAGATGGVLVAVFGFSIVFVLVSIFTFISALLLLLIRNDVIPRDKTLPRIPRSRLPF